MSIKHLFLPIFFCAGISYGQSSYPIEALFSLVEKNYPSNRQQILNLEGGRLIQMALATNWYPKLNIGGSATYQNEVTEFSIPGTGPSAFPTTKKDQYKIGIEISQTLFDAGLTKAQKEIEELNTLSRENSLDSEILNIKNAVLDVAISIMVAKNTMKQLGNTIENLKNRAKNIQIAIDNGVVLSVTKDEIEVELLQLDQQLAGITANIKTAYETLWILSGLEIDDQPDFEFMGMEAKRTVDFELRPEVLNMDIAILNLEWQKKQLNRKALPKLSLFADGYYGRPGYNFLNNDFRLYGIGGINLSFPITSLSYNHSVRKGLIIQKEAVELDKKKLTDQLYIQNRTLENNMKATLSYIGDDERIREKRQHILKVAQNQFDNGALLFSDYLQKLYDAQNAEINLQIHRLQLQQQQTKQKLLFNE